MKTMVQLNSERTKAHWKWQWDEVHPLSEMFTPEIVALMVDVTGQVPEPEDGWDFSSRGFSPPAPIPPPAPMTPEELLAKLETAKQELTDLLAQADTTTESLNASIQAAAGPVEVTDG